MDWYKIKKHPVLIVLGFIITSFGMGFAAHEKIQPFLGEQYNSTCITKNNTEVRLVAKAITAITTAYVFIERDNEKDKVVLYLNNAISNLRETKTVGSIGLLSEVRDQYSSISKGERQRKLDSVLNEIENKWKILIEYNKSNNPIKLKEEIDKCSKIIPVMFTIGIANTRLFSEMFKTMNLSMYDYLSKNKNIHPIFLDYLK